MKLYKLILLCLSVNCGFAQDITTAKIKAVSENGLHKMVVPAEIRSASKTDLSNFRIYDSANNEVPYAIVNPNQDGLQYNLSEFKIISTETVPNKKTTLIIENPKKKLEEITLQISNAEITKKFSISGSDNQKNWFGLVNSRELSDIKNGLATSDYKTIPLPVTSYKYLKLILNDSLSLPIKIETIGYISGEKKSIQYETLTPQKFEIKNQSSEKNTLISLKFNNPQLIHAILFNIKSPALYKRQVRIYKYVSKEIRRKQKIVQETLDNFELNPSKTAYQLYNPLLAKEFFIEIANRDNQPLEISSVKFSQQLIAIASDLKANEKYTVQTGNSNLTAPDYDLSYFTSNIQSKLPETEITDIQYSKKTETIAAPKKFWQTQWFMWVCIVIVGFAILYFSLSLAKDVQKK